MPLLSTSRRTTALAHPLPITNEYLARYGVVFRRGQFSLMAAAPTVGKSLFASNLVAHCPVSTLFFSADSDEWTCKTRCASIVTSYPLDKIDGWLSDGGTGEAYVYEALAKLDHVDWCYNNGIDIDFLKDRMAAHAEMRGQCPELTVIDNLGNMVTNPDNPWAELGAIAYELQGIARDTGSHVMGLCHVTGDKEKQPDSPIGLGDLLGKVGKVPEIVLGLNFVKDDETALNLTIPKNRNGKRLPTGFHIPVDYSRAWIGGWK